MKRILLAGALLLAVPFASCNRNGGTPGQDVDNGKGRGRVAQVECASVEVVIAERTAADGALAERIETEIKALFLPEGSTYRTWADGEVEIINYDTGKKSEGAYKIIPKTEIDGRAEFVITHRDGHQERFFIDSRDGATYLCIERTDKYKDTCPRVLRVSGSQKMQSLH